MAFAIIFFTTCQSAQKREKEPYVFYLNHVSVGDLLGVLAECKRIGYPRRMIKTSKARVRILIGNIFLISFRSHPHIPPQST